MTTGPKLSLFAMIALFAFMAFMQFNFITVPGLQVQAVTFNPDEALQGVALGSSALFTYGLLTGAIAWIEKRRSPKH